MEGEYDSDEYEEMDETEDYNDQEELTQDSNFSPLVVNSNNNGNVGILD